MLHLLPYKYLSCHQRMIRTCPWVNTIKRQHLRHLWGFDNPTRCEQTPKYVWTSNNVIYLTQIPKGLFCQAIENSNWWFCCNVAEIKPHVMLEVLMGGGLMIVRFMAPGTKHLFGLNCMVIWKERRRGWGCPIKMSWVWIVLPPALRRDIQQLCKYVCTFPLLQTYTDFSKWLW